MLQASLAQSLPRLAGREIEVQITAISDHTVRVTVLPLENGQPAPVPLDGSLVKSASGTPVARLRGIESPTQTVRAGRIDVTISGSPLTIAVGKAQQFKFDPQTAAVSFPTGEQPLLALGQGGPQFDRRGSQDRMRSGQGGYNLRTHGGRVPIQWLIMPGRGAMFLHQPLGSFDFTGAESRFQSFTTEAALPFDAFVVASTDPAAMMAEYARLTGLPEMPPLWSLGYQQSHRTLASRKEIVDEAKLFREKKLPCDTLIYLGTDFSPSGWNTHNGSFSFNRRVFDDPKAIFDELHQLGFKVVLHHALLARDLRGTVKDPCLPGKWDEEEAGCHWEMHRKTFSLGVDGWWPDEGDPLDARARLVRNRLYYEGPQIDRPNERPYALHRNGHAGMQRYAAFLWSGDVYSTWETLKTHVPVAVNTGLSGIPLWGTDIGGFVPTTDFTGELYVRWFQFGAFNPLFRAHGRTWKLRLPWGWNTGSFEPSEIQNYRGAANPDPAELRNAAVEPICKKYLELRSRLMPYLYSAVRESCQTGMPIIRALFLHYPDDPKAIGRGDEYLWGRDMLVAPVVEKGATSRSLYLPSGAWYDFWTRERLEGGREISRAVDLETTPLYVRAGGLIPMGPVKQFTEEKVEAPLEVHIYPGANGSFLLYEDDGKSFAYRKGGWMGIDMAWNDATRTLTLRLARGSRMLPPARRNIEAVLQPGGDRRTVPFEGKPVEIKF